MSWFNADKGLTGRKVVTHFACINETIVQMWVSPAFFKRQNFNGSVGIGELICGLPFYFNNQGKSPRV